MTSTANVNLILTGWLSRLAGQKDLLARGAQRFASLVSPLSELEVTHSGEGARSSATLRIVSGLHRGATMELTASDYLIGSGEDCDIVLCDPQVASHHCRLIQEWSGFVLRDLRTPTPRAISPGEVIYEGGAIEAQYDLGGVTLSLRQSALARARPDNRRARISSLLLPAVVIVTILLAVGSLVVPGHALQSVAVSGAARIAAGNRASFGSRHFTTSEVLEQARRALADENLHVELQDGRLYVEGRTPKLELKNRIHALAEDLRGTIAVEDHVAYTDAADSGSPGPLPVRVRSVMVSNPSYFLTDTGARYFVGGVLPDGAEVLAIGAGEIQFRRAGKIIAYKLQ